MLDTEAPDVSGGDGSHPLDALVDAMADVGDTDPTAAPDEAAPSADPSAQTTSAPTTTGQPRDPAGRFAPKASADGAADPSAPNPSSPAPEAAATTVEAQPSNPPTFTPPPNAEPVYVVADKTRHDIPGAFRTPDGGLYLPPSAADKAKHFIGMGIHHQTVWQQEREADRREILTLKHQMTQVKAEREVQYEAMTSELSRLLSDPQSVELMLTDPRGRDALVAHLTQQGELALYKYKAENPTPTVPPELAAYDAKRTLYAEADAVLAQAEQTPELGPILRGPQRDVALAIVQREVDRAKSPEDVDWAWIGNAIRALGATPTTPARAPSAPTPAKVSAFNAAQQQRRAPTPPPKAAAPKPGATTGKKAWSKEAFLRGELDD